MTQKNCRVALIALCCIGMSAAFFSNIQANDVIDRVFVNVPISCTMRGTGTNSHNAEMLNGTYNSAIGETTVKVTCNDNGGFTICAIGYTDDTDGVRLRLTDISSLANWDVGNVKDMKGLFQYNDSIVDMTGISGWDVRNITATAGGSSSSNNNFYFMFAKKYHQLSYWSHLLSVQVLGIVKGPIYHQLRHDISLFPVLHIIYSEHLRYI